MCPALGRRSQMMSANFSGIWTPPTPCQYHIHATSLPLIRILPRPFSQTRDAKVATTRRRPRPTTSIPATASGHASGLGHRTSSFDDGSSLVLARPLLISSALASRDAFSVSPSLLFSRLSARPPPSGPVRPLLVRSFPPNNED